MKVSVYVTSVLLAVVALFCLSSGDATIGSPVSDTIAAELYGGCGHKVGNNGCTDTSPCSASAYVTSAMNPTYSPNGNSNGTYCWRRVNGEEVCATCSDDVVPCSTGG